MTETRAARQAEAAHAKTAQESNGASLVDTRKKTVAQRHIGAFINDSPIQQRQQALASELANGPRAMQQRAFSKCIDGSARMTAQRRKTAELFGGDNKPAVQPAHLSTSTPNHTGLPDKLKSGIESLSGIAMDGIQVHYNSSKPAQLHAHAYAEGNQIHVGPGQEKHLPHEAWHLVQQAQERVGPTMQLHDGTAINDDQALEHEASVMGALAMQAEQSAITARQAWAAPTSATVQRKIGLELQSSWTVISIGQNANPDSKDVVYSGIYFQIEVDKGNGHAELEIVSYPLADRAAFDGCVSELRHVVGKLSEKKLGTFDIGPGDGWLEQTRIHRTSPTPIFRMQYTEGVTIENIPSLIEQFHPNAWRDMPDDITGKKTVEKKKTEKKKKRGMTSEADAYNEVDPTKIRGLTAAISMFLGDVGLWFPEKKKDDIKYAFTLMARTDFYAMYHDLDKDEAAQFQGLFAKDRATFAGYALDEQVCPRMKLELTVRQWLQSMVSGRPALRARTKDKVVTTTKNDQKDLMSPPPHLNSHGMIDDWNEKHSDEQHMKHAMGLYGLDDDGLALFELRRAGSPAGQDLELSIQKLEEILDRTAQRDPAFATKEHANLQDKRPRRRKAVISGGSEGNPLGTRAKEKLGQDYMPTQAQVTRMNVHNRQLEWVAPDGMCMLGALALLGGTTVRALRKAILDELADPGSRPCAYINEFAIEHDASEVRNVVKHLDTMWNNPAADAVLPVAAMVAGVGATVIEPDGTPIPVNGGGTILLHVANPVGHYHATKPA